MLNTAAEALSEALDFQGLGANSFEPGMGFRLVAAWNATVPLQPGESMEDFHQRASEAAGVNLPVKRRIPYDEDLFRRISNGRLVTCGELLAKTNWYEYEFALAASGTLAYLSIPAFVAGQLVGLACIHAATPASSIASFRATATRKR